MLESLRRRPATARINLCRAAADGGGSALETIVPVLCVENLVKRYGTTVAVDGVSFVIEPGEVYGLLGPNGAGKTTTISIVATLLRPDAGRVVIGEASIADDPRWRIGLVPQDLSLVEKLSGRENLQFFGKLYDLRGRELRERVEQRLADVGLTDRGNDRVSTYSGGMKRRLNIATALLHDPELLLMDEPTVGVDPQSRAYIFEIVAQLAARGVAVLYTTHYMEEAQRLCRRIGIMESGRILAEGTLAELVERVGGRRVLRLTADGLNPAVIAELSQSLGGAPATFNNGDVAFQIADPKGAIVALVQAAAKLNLPIHRVDMEEPNLETVFLELTGRALRD
jgi:ABC-2 type transport system ATP-binding protein